MIKNRNVPCGTPDYNTEKLSNVDVIWFVLLSTILSRLPMFFFTHMSANFNFDSGFSLSFVRSEIFYG
jgi:hypothetical protein